jgi:mRNA turnover protein 4
MAKNKRNKIVPLSKVGKKEHDKKNQILENVQKSLDQYDYCYAFSYKNMTAMPMQALRQYWKDSKFVIGKNKVLQVALGKTEDDSHKTNSFQLSPCLKGNCGLFFTNSDADLVLEYIRYLNIVISKTTNVLILETLVQLAHKP